MFDKFDPINRLYFIIFGGLEKFFCGGSGFPDYDKIIPSDHIDNYLRRNENTLDCLWDPRQHGKTMNHQRDHGLLQWLVKHKSIFGLYFCLLFC